MAWHWIIFCILAIFVFLEQLNGIRPKHARMVCMLFTLTFIFLSSIRWNQDVADWYGYFQIFSLLNINSITDVFSVYWAFEPLHFFIICAIKYYTNSYILVQVYMAIIAIGLFYFGARYATKIRKVGNKIYGTNHSIILAVYFVFWCTTFANVYTVRTSMAVAICLFSLKCIEERKLKRFLTYIFVASLFHFSAIVFIPAYFLYYKKLNMKMVVFFMVVCIIVGTIGIDKILSLAGFLGGRYAEKLLTYNVENGVANLTYYSYSTTFLLAKALANSAVVLLICFLIRKRYKNNPRFTGMMNLYFTGVLIQLLTVSYNIEVSRIAIYYQTFQYFLLSYSFTLFKHKDNKLLIYILLVIFMAVKMYSLYNREPGFSSFETIFS